MINETTTISLDDFMGEILQKTDRLERLLAEDLYSWNTTE